jgi:hypothetical protein
MPSCGNWNLEPLTRSFGEDSSLGRVAVSPGTALKGRWRHGQFSLIDEQVPNASLVRVRRLSGSARGTGGGRTPCVRRKVNRKLVLMRAHVRRLTGSLLSLWLALYLGAPQLVHPCPAHSTPAAGAAESAHASHHADHSASADQDSKDEQRRECCCPGPQCGAGSLVAGDAAAASYAALVASHAVVSPDATVSPAVRPAHLLPPATAPPAPIA